MLIACCGALVSFSGFVGDYTAAAGTFFGGSFKAGRSRIKTATAAPGRLAHAPHRGFPLGRLIVSSPLLL